MYSTPNGADHYDVDTQYAAIYLPIKAAHRVTQRGSIPNLQLLRKYILFVYRGGYEFNDPRRSAFC